MHAVQRQAANPDDLAVSGADIVQSPVVGDLKRDASWRRSGKDRNEDTLVCRQEKAPEVICVATSDRRTRRKVQAEEFMGRGKPEFLRRAVDVEDGAEPV